MKIQFWQSNKVGFALWFFIGITIAMALYQAFEQLIIQDSAYHIYMSQVVFRGDQLFSATTYGYTPLGTLIVALFMKLGSLFLLDTISSARIAGILLYGSICGTFYILSSETIKSQLAQIVACVLFTGLGYLAIISGTNAEPKLWVLFFSILGLIYIARGNWFLTGLYFSAAAMCWQPAVISLAACVVMLPWKSEKILTSGTKLLYGIALGTLPVLLYLYATEGWADFWQQAVLRKLTVEGETLGESPMIWLLNGVYPAFVPEIFHFIFGFLGFIWIAYLYVTKTEKLSEYFVTQKIAKFMMIYVVMWGMFNSLEFQGPKDLLPIIPVIIIFAQFFISAVTLKNLKASALIVLGSVLLFYNYFDAFIYKPPFTYSDEKELIEDLRQSVGKVFVIGFEEFYTILEEPMPTKYMRYEKYEDHLIKKTERGFSGIKQFIEAEQFDYIVAFNGNQRSKSFFNSQITESFKRFLRGDKQKWERGECAQYLIEELTNSKEHESFKIRAQLIPLGSRFIVNRHYSIFRIK